MKHCLLCCHCFTVAAHLCVCLSGLLTRSSPHPSVDWTHCSVTLSVSRTWVQEIHVAHPTRAHTQTNVGNRGLSLAHTQRTGTQRQTRGCVVFYCTADITKIILLIFHLLQQEDEAEKTFLLLWFLWKIFAKIIFLQVTFIVSNVTLHVRLAMTSMSKICLFIVHWQTYTHSVLWHYIFS